MFTMRNVLFLILTLVLLLGTQTANAFQNGGEDKKDKISGRKFHSLKKSLDQKAWYTRVIAAISGRQYEDTKVLQVLVARYHDEKDIRVKLFLLESLGSWKAEDLQPFVDKKMLDGIATMAAKAQDEFTLHATHAFLTAVFGKDVKKNGPTLNAAWRSIRSKWGKIHEKAIEKWEAVNGPLTESAVDVTYDPDARLIGSGRMNDMLAEYQVVPLEIAIMIDDTERMQSHADDLRKALMKVINAWKQIAPKVKIGFVTYSTEGVNVQFKPNTDIPKILKAIKILDFSSDDEQLFSPLGRVINILIGKNKWSKQSIKHMICIGATPVMQAHQGAVSGKIKMAVAKGFMTHFFGINQGSNVAPKNVDEFDTYARSGDGVDVIITAKTDLGVELFEVVFGVGSFEFLEEFTHGLLLHGTPLLKKR